MRIEDALNYDKELIDYVNQYGRINESYGTLVESIQDKVAQEASLYHSDNPPESVILEDPQDSNHYVVLMSGDGKHTVLHFMNGRVVEEDRRADSFNQLMSFRDKLVGKGYKKVDNRSWYVRNWRMVAAALVGGVLSVAAAPLIAAELTLWGTMIRSVAEFLGLLGGGGAGGIGKLAAGGLGALGFARAIDYFRNKA